MILKMDIIIIYRWIITQTMINRSMRLDNEES